MNRWLTLSCLVGALFALAACGGSPPSSINNVCAVFDQRDGFFNDWYATARKAERRHGIPVHVLMATMRVESGFDGDARPPRHKVLGVVPWKRKSSAFGYSQALNGTWAQYRRETGRTMARRGDFSDAVDFIGWYHAKTAKKYGVHSHDAYNLYLGYRYGWSGFARGAWRGDPGGHKTAAKTASIANSYALQLRNCR